MRANDAIPPEELQRIVERIAYEQYSEDQMGDLYAKMGILSDFVHQKILAAKNEKHEYRCVYCKTLFDGVDGLINHYATRDKNCSMIIMKDHVKDY